MTTSRTRRGVPPSSSASQDSDRAGVGANEIDPDARLEEASGRRSPRKVGSSGDYGRGGDTGCRGEVGSNGEALASGHPRVRKLVKGRARCSSRRRRRGGRSRRRGRRWRDGGGGGLVGHRRERRGLARWRSVGRHGRSARIDGEGEHERKRFAHLFARAARDAPCTACAIGPSDRDCARGRRSVANDDGEAPCGTGEVRARNEACVRRPRSNASHERGLVRTARSGSVVEVDGFVGILGRGHGREPRDEDGSPDRCSRKRPNSFAHTAECTSCAPADAATSRAPRLARRQQRGPSVARLRSAGRRRTSSRRSCRRC
jgi:hypothetical protein